jgi:predicted permease
MMRLAARLRSLARHLFRRAEIERQLADEWAFHLASRADDLAASRGLPPDEAMRVARLEFGCVDGYREEMRRSVGLALWDEWRGDVRFAWRTFRRSPAFTIASTLTLAFGIGATTAMFGVWYAVLHAPLPGVARPGELVMLTNPSEAGLWSGRSDGPRSWLTYEEFAVLQQHATSLSSMFATQSSLASWPVRVGRGAWETASMRLVSGGFFEALGAGPTLGRVFTDRDDRSAAPVAVVSHSYWQRRFGGRRDVIGTTITVRNVQLTIIGVAADGFIGETAGERPDLWLPLRLQPTVMPGNDWLHDTPPQKVMWLHVFGRLRSPVTLAQAGAESNAIFQGALRSFYGVTGSPERQRELLDQRVILRSGAGGASPTRDAFAEPLTALLAAVAVLLLMACANLANLLIARGAARRSEMALRLSLGARRARLVRQLITESLLLAGLGGVVAVPVAFALHGALVRMLASSYDDFYVGFALNVPVVTCLVVVTFAAALLFGALPAWQVADAEPVASLNDRGRGSSGSRRRLRSDRVLAALQLALSLPLLIGAGLLVRTVYNLQRVDVGFPAERLLLVRVNLRDAGYDGTRADSALRDLRTRVGQLPGVRAVSFSQLGLFSGGESTHTVAVEGYTPTGRDDRGSAFDAVGPAYFTTLGIPVVRGRDILDGDATASRVAVVNEAFSRRFFAHRDPIGLHITAGREQARRTYEVVGVTSDAHTRELRGEIAPRYFVPPDGVSAPAESPTFLVRTLTSPTTVMSGVRNAIRQFDPALVVMSARSIEQQMSPLTAQDRVTASLAVTFGLVALVLAAVGLYGVVAFSIAGRRNEIAIRIAVGAEPGRVTAMILGESLHVVVAGLAIGAGLGAAAARVIGGRLYGVTPDDPLTIVAAGAVLVLIASVATFVPARRASRLDPIAALRQP